LSAISADFTATEPPPGSSMRSSRSLFVFQPSRQARFRSRQILAATPYVGAIHQIVPPSIAPFR
jgi:hypothetical protein